MYVSITEKQQVLNEARSKASQKQGDFPFLCHGTKGNFEVRDFDFLLVSGRDIKMMKFGR